MRSGTTFKRSASCGLIVLLIAITGALTPVAPAGAAGGDHSVSGTGCWKEVVLMPWYWLPLIQFDCLQIEASTEGGGSGVVNMLDGVIPVLALQLDCVVAEESSSGHTIYASGIDPSGNRGWVTVTPQGFSAGQWGDSVAPCGAGEYVRQADNGGYTIGHIDPTPNILPTPAFESTCIEFTCTFDASGSTDADGEVVGYRWYVERKWYDMDTRTKHTGQTFTLSLPQANLLGVTLIVTDEDGGSGRITQDVNVGLPISKQAQPSCKGLTCTFDASASTDPDGTVTRYHWNLWTEGSGGSTDGPSLTHTYSASGTYYAGVRVEDDEGNVSPWMDWVEFEVTAPPFELTGGLRKQGQRYRVDLRWSGAATSSVDVFRNEIRIATISGQSSYSESVTRGQGTLTYKVCDAGSSRCSNTWTTSV